MLSSNFDIIEKYMLECMGASAHDKDHVYRVLYVALDIARTEKDVDSDVLIAACLLHDIGRREQAEDPALDHAEVGAKKAGVYLRSVGASERFAERVSECILTHRFRVDHPPQSIEAKILFDADKIDVAGAIGIARTLVYRGEVEEPLYTLDASGLPDGGEGKGAPSFFREYKYKLERIYDRLFTARGREIAEARRQAAVDFYDRLLGEVRDAYAVGRDVLKKHLD